MAFLNLLHIYTKGRGRTYFSADFWTSRNFGRNFPKSVAPSSNKNENYLAHLKGQSLLKKTLKTASKSTQNSDTKPAQIIPPRTNSAPASERDKKNRWTYKHHIFAPTAGARCTIFPQTLRGDRARRDHQKGANGFFFDPTHSFSYRGHGKIWPNWPTTRDFSALTP